MLRTIQYLSACVPLDLVSTSVGDSGCRALEACRAACQVQDPPNLHHQRVPTGLQVCVPCVSECVHWCIYTAALFSLSPFLFFLPPLPSSLPSLILPLPSSLPSLPPSPPFLPPLPSSLPPSFPPYLPTSQRSTQASVVGTTPQLSTALQRAVRI